jgi:hypothetical protein
MRMIRTYLVVLFVACFAKSCARAFPDLDGLATQGERHLDLSVVEKRDLGSTLECSEHADCPSDRYCNRSTNRCNHKRETGAPCNSDEKCGSGKCVDSLCVPDYGNCYSDQECPVDFVCYQGLCIYDEGCTNNYECPYHYYCENGDCIYYNECFADSECPTQHLCDHGQCVLHAECDSNDDCYHSTRCILGFCKYDDACAFDLDCSDDFFCSDGECVPLCRSDDECIENYWCDLETLQCVEKLPSGDICELNIQCSSGWCDSVQFPNRCRRPRPNTFSCQFDYQCRSNFCFERTCQDKVELGESCTADIQCSSTLCIDNSCQNLFEIGASCTLDKQCNSAYCSCILKICAVLKADNALCDFDCECANGWCYLGEFCKSKAAVGEPCLDNVDCVSGSCDNHDCGWWNVGGNHCGAFKCVPIMGEFGDFCTHGFQCKSNFCYDNACDVLTGMEGDMSDASDPVETSTATEHVLQDPPAEDEDTAWEDQNDQEDDDQEDGSHHGKDGKDGDF